MEAVAQEAPKTRMMAVRLLRHYVPRGTYEIVGHHKAAVIGKDSGGREVELKPEEYVKGECHPPAYPGVGYPNKIWSSTDIRLPADEAKAIIQQGVAVRSVDD